MPIGRKQEATKKTKDSAACQKSVTFVLSVSLRARFLPVGLPGRRVGSTEPEANVQLKRTEISEK